MYGYPHNATPQVNIGSSYGHVTREISLYNNGYKVGTMFVYNHYNIQSGTFDVKYYNLYDNSVYVR